MGQVNGTDRLLGTENGAADSDVIDIILLTAKKTIYTSRLTLCPQK